jgi:hypothetical protein
MGGVGVRELRLEPNIACYGVDARGNWREHRRRGYERRSRQRGSQWERRQERDTSDYCRSRQQACVWRRRQCSERRFEQQRARSW